LGTIWEHKRKKWRGRGGERGFCLVWKGKGPLGITLVTLPKKLVYLFTHLKKFPSLFGVHLTSLKNASYNIKDAPYTYNMPLRPTNGITTL
jgi:hypothetical protein